jgi:CubicO group peptidase (beta-lactamase class C family)
VGRGWRAPWPSRSASTPLSHAAARRHLYGLGDNSSTYLWRVLAARRRAGIFNTYYWIDRSAGVGAAIMTQVLPFFDAKIVEALLGFEVAVYAQVGAAVAPIG